MQLDVGWSYQVQASTNFTNWTVLTTFTPSTSIYSYIDTTSPGIPYRFYRLMAQ
jgi:hypothetical protein